MADLKSLVEVFRNSLREFGYVEGHNLQIEVRLVERHEELPQAAAELVRDALGSLAPVLRALDGVIRTVVGREDAA